MTLQMSTWFTDPHAATTKENKMSDFLRNFLNGTPARSSPVAVSSHLEILKIGPRISEFQVNLEIFNKT